MKYSIDKSALVLHSAEKMFALVNDVQSYPLFLPWCADSAVLSSSPGEVKASLTVAKGGFQQQLTTRNVIAPPSSILMSLVTGPFHSLAGEWRFQSLADNACRVSLTLEFEFSNALARVTFGPVFSHAANTMVDAFCQRADRLYGKGSLD